MGSNEDLTLLRQFRRAAHRLDNMKKHHGQGRLLSLLREKGTLTQRELRQITGRRSATLSEQLDHMEDAGFITRERNAEDRRNVDVTLTEEGKEAAVQVAQERAELAERLFAPLTEEEKRRLEGLMKKLLPVWEKEAERK